jgi:hypothetical protein
MAEFKACSSCQIPKSNFLQTTSTTPAHSKSLFDVNGVDKYTGCAPIMSDGRLFTNWTPRCAQVYGNENQLNSYDSRQKLINHAEELMKKNAGEAYLNAKCGPCYENPDWNTGTMLPELHIQTCDARTCTFTPNSEDGLGLGRYYWNPKMESDYQKQLIKAKEQEQQFFKEQLQGSINPFGADYLPF